MAPMVVMESGQLTITAIGAASIDAQKAAVRANALTIFIYTLVQGVLVRLMWKCWLLLFWRLAWNWQDLKALSLCFPGGPLSNKSHAHFGKGLPGQPEPF